MVYFSIITRGTFFNYYLHGKIETGHARLRAAHKMFGIGDDLDEEQLERGEYEKYGNLLDHDILRSIKNNTAIQFGNVEVRFKKCKVVATWTPCDSLGVRNQPTLCSDPRSCSYDNNNYLLGNYSDSTSNLVKWKGTHISSYLELQYHGKLTPDCVESLTYPYDLTSQQRTTDAAVAMKWIQKGVRVFYVANIDGKDVLCELKAK